MAYLDFMVLPKNSQSIQIIEPVIKIVFGLTSAGVEWILGMFLLIIELAYFGVCVFIQ